MYRVSHASSAVIFIDFCASVVKVNGTVIFCDGNFVRIEVVEIVTFCGGTLIVVKSVCVWLTLVVVSVRVVFSSV